MPETINDADLQAYVDGQLDVASRIEVERWLQGHPEAAAQVMEGLRVRDELQLFLTEDTGAGAAETVRLARELSRRLRSRTTGLRVRRAIAAAVLVGAGWLAHAEYGLLVDQVAAAHPVPALAAEAATALARLRDDPAAGRRGGDRPVALQAARSGGEVPIPPLGADARLLRADLVPWAQGTALAALYRTGDGSLVGLLAAEADGFAVAWPEGFAVRGHPVVFWQTGPFAYALSGGDSEAELLAIAREAAPRPWPGFDR